MWAPDQYYKMNCRNMSCITEPELPLNRGLQVCGRYTLWSAALYQESDTIREAADAALELYEIVTGRKEFDRTSWTAASRKSLCAGFNEADPDAIIAWNKRMAGLGRRYYIWS